VPSSGEVTGILKDMGDEMSKALAEATKTEKGAIATFEGLAAAKKKEIDALTAAIEAKTERLGQTKVDIVNLKEELDDTAKAMLADRKFLANLGTSCDTKKKEWEARSKTRTEELAALAETIRLLNDDDSLELFKKTLPSPSLIEMKVSSSTLRRQAASILKSASKQKDPRMELVMLALTGKSVGFGKVLKMIDEMVALLGTEQGDDDAKKAYCEASLDKTEDELKALNNNIADLEKAMEMTKSAIETLTSEIAALIAGVEALDKSVAEATATRKAENAEFKSTMAADSAAKELIGLAKNRMNQFYNPDLYVAAPKRELSEEVVCTDMHLAPCNGVAVLQCEGLPRIELDEQARPRVVLAHALRLLVETAAGQRLHQVWDGLTLDADVPRQHVVADGDGDGLDGEVALVQHEGQGGPDLALVDAHPLLPHRLPAAGASGPAPEVRAPRKVV